MRVRVTDLQPGQRLPLNDGQDSGVFKGLRTEDGADIVVMMIQVPDGEFLVVPCKGTEYVDVMDLN